MLALGKKSSDKPRQHIKKWRHHFADKGLYSQSYGFCCSRVWVWKLDHKVGWAWIIYAFELWCWRRLSRVPWTARRSNQSVLKEMNPEYALEGLKLKLQYFDNLEGTADLLEKTLMLKRLSAGGEGGNRGWDSWMASPTQWTWVWANSGRSWRMGISGMLQSTGSQRIEHDLRTEQQNIKSVIPKHITILESF